MSRDELVDLITRLQAGLAELGGVEAKRAMRDVPSGLAETLCAFANSADGGTILLGVDESVGFEVSGVENVDRVSSRVGQICRDEIEPPLQAVITSQEVDNKHVVVVEVPEILASLKPCFVKSRGIANGAFLRLAGSNRRFTQYEIGILLASRTQPRDDVEAVPGATMDDLDEALVDRLIRRVRRSRGPVLATAETPELLRHLGVMDPGGNITVAGLLALGTYPQRHFPQLDITFVALPSEDSHSDGTRFLDSASLDGSIPTILDQAMARIALNMRRRAVVGREGRIDVPDYPEAALREALANAVMHRDYSPASRGTQIRIQMFPDRIEIDNPGGLFGPISRESLEAGEPVSSSRNATLAKLLEDVTTSDDRAVAENRASGIPAMIRALRDARLPPPELVDEVGRFAIRFRNGSLLDSRTTEWISSLDQEGLGHRQTVALALARTGRPITNALYRAVGGCDAETATRDLVDLRNRGLIVRTGVGNRTAWRLNPSLVANDDRAVPRRPGRLTSESREQQVRRLLQTGDKSSRELSDATGLGTESIRNYLNRLRSAGVVEPTTDKIRSPATRWRLRSSPDSPRGQTSLPLEP